MKLLIIFALCLTATAKEFQCSLDLSPVGKEIPQDKIGQYVKTFRFDTTKNKVGTQVSFNNFDLKMWIKDGLIITMLKDIKRKIAVTTKSDTVQNEIYLKMTPDVLVRCQGKEVWAKNNKALAKSLVPDINDQTDLSLEKYNLIFKLDNDILFKYFQANSNDHMRTIIFQEGKIIRNSREKDKSKPWCAFQIEIKLDEDTVVYRGTELPPSTVKVLKNSSTHYVLSYSFVDFASGKRNFHTSRYTPFSLECQLPVGITLSYGLFKEITGKRLIIEGQK